MPAGVDPLPLGELFQPMLEAIAEAVIATRPDGTIILWNPAAERLFGWRAAEVLGRSLLDVTPTEAARAQARALLGGEPGGGANSTGALELRRRDGSTFPGQVTHSPVRDASGALVAVIGITRDLTGELRAERHRREQAALLAAQLDAAPYGISIVMGGRVHSVNRRYLDLWATTEAQVVGRDVGELVREKAELAEDRADFIARGLSVASGADEEFALKDGRVLRRHAVPVRIPESGFEAEVAFFSDVTLERRARKALELKVRQHQAIGELAQGMMVGGPRSWLLDQVARHLSNALEAQLIGIWRSEQDGGLRLVSGRGWPDHAMGRLCERDDDVLPLRAALETNAPVEIRGPCFDYPAVRRGVALRIGAKEPWGVVGVYVRNEQALRGGAVAVFEAVVNVLALALERTQAEESLRHSEKLLRELVDQVPDGLSVWTSTGELILCNRSAARMMDLPPERVKEGAPIEEIFGPEMAPRSRARLEECLARRQELPPVDYHMNGHRVIEARAVPFEFGGQQAAISISRDVTERRQIEARMMVADRMASVGQLAAGVAHELNNPLAWVLSNLRYMDEELARGAQIGAEFRDALKDAAQGAERMAVIVRDLKTFSRADEASVETSLVTVTETALKMTGAEVRRRARVVTRFAPAPRVLGNEARLGQVLINLLVNAAQAMPSDDPDQHSIEVGVGTGSDGWAELVVKDTGAGIPPKDLKRIFEPFFTTKEVGVGTGLGLTVVHTLVTRMGGTISVDSKVGVGTTFTLRFPPAPQKKAGRPATVETVPPPRRGKLLIIDDEEPILVALRRILETQHDVQCLHRGEEALAVLDSDRGFDVILCDVMMPGLGGPGFHAEMERRFPELLPRVVYMTGGAFTPGAASFLDQVAQRLDKPFEPSAVRALINARIRGA